MEARGLVAGLGVRLWLALGVRPGGRVAIGDRVAGQDDGGTQLTLTALHMPSDAVSLFG